MFLRITAGSLKGRRVTTLDDGFRPTEEKVRAALFNTLFALRDLEGRVFIDLFAGSGAVGMEAISRGAHRVVFCEQDRRRARHLTGQLELLGIAGHGAVKICDAFSEDPLGPEQNKADIIFIDPPYADRDRVPPLVERCIERGLCAADGLVITETDVAMPTRIAGWDGREKRYGGTFLTFYAMRSEP